VHAGFTSQIFLRAYLPAEGRHDSSASATAGAIWPGDHLGALAEPGWSASQAEKTGSCAGRMPVYHRVVLLPDHRREAPRPASC
jgi:hypothetical protein